MLCIIDEFSRESLAIRVARKLKEPGRFSEGLLLRRLHNCLWRANRKRLDLTPSCGDLIEGVDK